MGTVYKKIAWIHNPDGSTHREPSPHFRVLEEDVEFKIRIPNTRYRDYTVLFANHITVKSPQTTVQYNFGAKLCCRVEYERRFCCITFEYGMYLQENLF